MKDEKPKLIKLLSVLRDLREKEQAILDEIDTLLGGGVGVGEQLKTIQRAFSDAWYAAYWTAYVFNFAKDVPQMKRLLKATTVEDIVSRCGSYLANGDPFFQKGRHSFGMFVATFNQHASVRPETDLDGLEADAAETQRKRQAIRR